MSDIQIFNNPEFGDIRTVELNGEPWFVGKDVALALGYTNPQKAIRDHVDEQDKGVNEMFTPGGKQALPIINEFGLYSLALSSKLPTAKKFKRWVTSEVLPSIRKHGAYMTPETLQNAILNPDTMIQLCQQLKAEQNKNKALTAENKKLAPAAEYAHNMLLSDESLTVTQIALNFGMTANKLNKLLDEWGIQRKVNKQWIPKRKYIDKGYTLSIPVEVGNGETKENTRWTRSGQAFIYKQLHDHGYKTVKEQQEDKAKERKVLPTPAEQTT